MIEAFFTHDKRRIPAAAAHQATFFPFGVQRKPYTNECAKRASFEIPYIEKISNLSKFVQIHFEMFFYFKSGAFTNDVTAWGYWFFLGIFFFEIYPFCSNNWVYCKWVYFYLKQKMGILTMGIFSKFLEKWVYPNGYIF